MYMTVRETLAEPALRELRLIAGASGLDRHVTRVSVLEVPDGFGLWTWGGELFMSTMNALRDDCAGQVKVLRTLFDNNIAALCLHPGLSEIQFLDELAEVADECGLPLITMPRDMPYAVVADAVVGGLRGRQAALIQRSATIHREFIQQTLRGQDLDALCRVVSRRTQRPVAVIGPDGSDILADGGSPRETSYDYDIEDLLRNRGTLSQEPGAVSVPIHSLLDTGGPDYVLKVEIPTSNGPVTQVAAPVVIGTETVAYLVTWELGPPMSEFDLSVLAHACTAVGLVVLRRKAVMDAELQIQQGFYGAAISGEFKTVDEAASRAAGVGVTITSRYIVATVQSSRLKSTGDLKELRRWPGSVSVLAGNQHALLLHVPDHERRPESQARDLLQRLSERFTRPDAQSLIGQSRTVSSILELPAALLQARTALFTAEQLNISTPVVHYDDLGVYQLLGQIGDLPAVRAFTTEAIKQIRQARGGAELLRTLEAYLDAQGSHRAAASTLSIHPNTVKYRITRIREMLGDGIFDDPGKRLGVHLALKARHLQD